MRSLIVRFLVLVTVVGLLATAGAGSPFKERLSSLRSSDAAAYFKLGEDIADAARSQADRDLAIHLFVLADHLDRNRYHRSALLAILPMIEDPAVISLIQTDLRSITDVTDLVPVISEPADRRIDAISAVVDFLSAFRRADREAMEEILRQEGVSEQLGLLQHRLPGDVDWMLTRVSTARRDIGFLTEDDIMSTLRVQAALLGSRNTPWSTELHATNGRPMTVIEPVPLTEIFNIDPQQLIWRNGQWE